MGLGLGIDYTCQGCMRKITAPAGDDVKCKRCGVTYETDWELQVGDDGIADTVHGWITRQKK